MGGKVKKKQTIVDPPLYLPARYINLKHLLGFVLIGNIIIFGPLLELLPWLFILASPVDYYSALGRKTRF